jgi:hypothetical protein
MIAYALWAGVRPEGLIPPTIVRYLCQQPQQSYAERPKILANAAKSFICKGF